MNLIVTVHALMLMVIHMSTFFYGVPINIAVYTVLVFGCLCTVYTFVAIHTTVVANSLDLTYLQKKNMILFSNF